MIEQWKAELESMPHASENVERHIALKSMIRGYEVRDAEIAAHRLTLDAAYKLDAERQSEIAKLREMVKAAREGLEFYAKAQHVMRESEPKKGNVCPPFGHYARATLARLDEMEGK